MYDLPEFFGFIKRYFFTRVLHFGGRFESLKDLIVALLIAKRGKYSSSFLNIAFFLIAGTAFVAGPIIAENNPFSSSSSQYSEDKYKAAVISYNPYDNPLSTIISAKPRNTVVEYNVVSGDTLASIAKRFDISVDTIKWANNLKSDTIKPNQALEIPPVTGVVHKVVSGENIYTIAKKYSTDAQKIVNFPFNDFADLETFSIMAGQTLFVPDGVIEAEKPAYVAQNFAQIQAGVRGSSNFIWPTTGIITQYPVWYHMALDIANPAQPPILASDTGTVIYAGCLQWGYGCHIIVDHANGFQTLYGHLSAIDISQGEAVSQGQKIGNMGSSGRSSGTHLHFEIRNGGLQNPLGYLQ